MISSMEIILRIFISSLIGGLIGIEREVHNRPAGLRTHVLVTVGSSLIMLISIDGFNSLGPDRLGDPARLAAQVVSGIGFLGAGTIMRTGTSIQGLTTAASLWVSAGIGLGIGAGYYLGTISAAVISLITLMSLGRLEKKVLKSKYKNIQVSASNRPGIIGQIGVVLGNHHISIKDISILENDFENDEDSNIMEISFTVKVPGSFDTYSLYNEIYEISGVKSLVYQDEKIKKRK